MSDRLVRLLLIDEDPIFRLGLRAWLERQTDWQIVAEADSVAVAQQRLNLPMLPLPETADPAFSETAFREEGSSKLSLEDQSTRDSGTRGNADETPHSQTEEIPDAPPEAVVSGTKATRKTTRDRITKKDARKSSPLPDLVILDLALGSIREAASLQLQPPIASLPLCQRIKAAYPTLPVFFVGSPQDVVLLDRIRSVGASGFCSKAQSATLALDVLRQIAEGETYWPEQPPTADQGSIDKSFIKRSIPLALGRDRTSEVRSGTAAGSQADKKGFIGPLFQSRNRLRVAGQTSIQDVLTDISQQLQAPGLALWQREILKGRRRELLVAGWMVNQLLLFPWERGQLSASRGEQPDAINSLTQSRSLRVSKSAIAPGSNVRNSPDALRAALFDNTLAKLQAGLVNLTPQPLEIDILQDGQKRELLYIILRKIEDGLDDLQHSKIQPQHLPEKRLPFLQTLWQAAIEDFFGKYYTLTLENRTLDVVPTLLEERPIVEQAILQRIPQVESLLAHLLFQAPLLVDNLPSQAGSPAAMRRAEALLQNLMIRIANGIVQPLLNRFAHVTEIKQTFYQRRLLSTREIERFRNDLSWKYRLHQYLSEPRAIFESQFPLLVFTGRGIQQVRIYAPRDRELEELTGLQRLVTLSLETRDAIAPRLRSVVSFFGSGLVYLLTQVLGRSIGLIGRGILQSMGSIKKDQARDKTHIMRD